MTENIKCAENPPARPDMPEKLQRMIEQQGVAHTATFEYLLGSGADLWETDEEFDDFVKLLNESRNETE